MRGEFSRRRMARVLVAAMFAVSLAATGPTAPQAHALAATGPTARQAHALAAPPDWLNPCNLPGGKWACTKALEGSMRLYEKADSAVEDASQAVDFATDPLGHLEQKIRSGAKELFAAFGEELTGKKPADPKNGKKGKGD